MKHLPVIRLFFAFCSSAILFISCSKDHEIKKREFEAGFKTWYRISPLAKPVPIDVNGTAFVGFAHFPGGGTGNNSLLGNSTTYFNQLAYGNAPDAPPAGSVGAAIIEVPGYPVTGAPLPLIQAGDFNGLASAISSLKIPESVYDKIVNQVFYNEKGDAIFSSALTGEGSTFPISQTIVGFNGKAVITGGRGKFRHAVGEFEFSGYFNVANADDAEYNAKGWISF